MDGVKSKGPEENRKGQTAGRQALRLDTINCLRQALDLGMNGMT
jgi:hypothetical protein